jgi:sterol desaturase/sphingolipid hydroxylase (fatty acid hydroxylase superfamily)
VTFVNPGLLFSAYVWLYDHVRLFDLPGAVLPWVVAIVGYDFAYYWWHRMSHRVNFFWAAHVVHHQSEDYNLAVALRQSVTTQLTGFPVYATLSLVGVPPLHFAAAAGLSLLYQFWIHTELVPKLGWYESVFNTPSLHRVHHAINPQYLDKNHAGTLIVWDKLFGTWTPEVAPCVYGTTRPIRSFNSLWAQLDGWVELGKLSKQAPNFTEAVKVWFKGPDWWPAWMGQKPAPPPYDPRAFVKYEVPLSPRLRAYVLVQFLAAGVAIFCFVTWGHTLPLAMKLSAAALILWTVGCIGGLVEARPWAKPAEISRLAAVAAFLVVLGTRAH